MVNFLFDGKQSIHQRLIIHRYNGTDALASAGFIFLMNPFMYTGKFHIPVIFFHKRPVFLLQIIQFFQNFIQRSGMFIIFLYILQYKPMGLKIFHKGFPQRDIDGIVLILILRKHPDCFPPFFLQFHTTGNQFHFFFTDFSETEGNILHGFINQPPGGVFLGKHLLLVDAVNAPLYFGQHFRQPRECKARKRRFQRLIPESTHKIAAVPGGNQCLFHFQNFLFLLYDSNLRTEFLQIIRGKCKQCMANLPHLGNQCFPILKNLFKSILSVVLTGRIRGLKTG